MKRLILIAALLVSAVTFSYAQESAAKRAFTAGDYSAAVELYQAAIATSGTNSALSSGLEQAKKCASLKKKADAAYSSGSYKTAQRNYQEILKLNPSDSYARGRISKCSQRLAAAQAKAAQVAKDEEFQNGLSVAFAIGTPTALKAFAAKLPKDERSQLLLDYCRILENKNKLLTPDDVVVCRSVGKLQKSSACDAAFDKAISYCDLEAMYVRAIGVLSDTDSQVESRVKMMDLLAMASNGGYEPAKTALAEYKEKTLGTPGFSAARYFAALRDCERDASQAVFVLANLKNYPVSDISTLKLRVCAALSSANANLMQANDLNLFAAQAILDSEDPLKEKLLRAAARKGNLDADLELSKLPSCRLEKDMLRKIYNRDQVMGLTEQGFSEYVKYLKNDIIEIDPLLLRSWLQNRIPYLSKFPFGWGAWNTDCFFRHDYLYAAILAFKKSPDQSNYDQVVMILDSYKNNVWNSDMVSEYLVLASGTDKYSGKLRKKLKSLKTSSSADGKKSSNPMYRYALEGYFDNMHNSRTYKSYSGLETYEVGDLIANALVFSVDGNGRTGKVVMKMTFTAGSASEITNHLTEMNKKSWAEYGSVKWRVATAAEYYTMFKQGYITIGRKGGQRQVFCFNGSPIQGAGFIAYDGKYAHLFAKDENMYQNSAFHGFSSNQKVYSYILVADFR